MKTISSLILITGLAVGHVASAGDITGTVTLKGTPPPERPNVYVKNDVKCAKLITDTPTTHFYVVGPNAELADTVVMLKNVAGKSTGASVYPS